MRSLPGHPNAVSLPFTFPADAPSLKWIVFDMAYTADANINTVIFLVIAQSVERGRRSPISNNDQLFKAILHQVGYWLWLGGYCTPEHMWKPFQVCVYHIYRT